MKSQSFVSHMSSCKPGYGGSESKVSRNQIQGPQDKNALPTQKKQPLNINRSSLRSQQGQPSSLRAQNGSILECKEWQQARMANSLVKNDEGSQ